MHVNEQTNHAVRKCTHASTGQCFLLFDWFVLGVLSAQMVACSTSSIGCVLDGNASLVKEHDVSTTICHCDAVWTWPCFNRSQQTWIGDSSSPMISAASCVQRRVMPCPMLCSEHANALEVKKNQPCCTPGIVWNLWLKFCSQNESSNKNSFDFFLTNTLDFAAKQFFIAFLGQQHLHMNCLFLWCWWCNPSGLKKLLVLDRAHHHDVLVEQRNPWPTVPAQLPKCRKMMWVAAMQLISWGGGHGTHGAGHHWFDLICLWWLFLLNACINKSGSVCVICNLSSKNIRLQQCHHPWKIHPRKIHWNCLNAVSEWSSTCFP